MDVVSLEKSKELGDEFPIINHSGDSSRVMLKRCNLLEKIGSNLALYCIETYSLMYVFVYLIDLSPLGLFRANETNH